MKNAGRAGIVPKDDFDINIKYKRLDAVMYDKSLYIAKKDVPLGTLPTDTTYWMKSICGNKEPIATTETAGIVKPDGITITVDVDGTLHGNSEVTVDSELSKESENPVQNKTVAEELEKKINSDGDSKDLTATFTSNDSTNVTEWTDVGLLTSGEKHSSLFQKIATMFKNIRYLYHMLGTADISTLGEGANIGTVTGAISKLNSDNTYGRKVYNSGTLLDILEQELDNMNKHTDWGFIVTNEVSDLKNYFPEIKGWYIFSIKTQANESICKVYDSWYISRSYEFIYFKSTREINQLYYSDIGISFKKFDTYVANANNVTEFGTYLVSPDTINTPFTMWGRLYNIGIGDWKTQIIIPAGDVGLFIRNNTNNEGWTDWSEILTDYDRKNTVIWLPIDIEIGILNTGQEVLDAEYHFDIPEGYQSCAICGYQLNGSGYTYCTVTAFIVSGNKIIYSVRNMSDLATGDIRLITSIMCIKTNFGG